MKLRFGPAPRNARFQLRSPSSSPFVPWYYGSSGGTTHPGGRKLPNALGLYDMSGNVWEWVQDAYRSYGSAAVTDPPWPTTVETEVFRGASWGNDASELRVTNRNLGIEGRSPLGFRLVRAQ